jgi:hypothetical protein
MHTVKIKVSGNKNMLLSRDDEGIISAQDVNIYDLQSLLIGNNNKIIGYSLKSDYEDIDKDFEDKIIKVLVEIRDKIEEVRCGLIDIEFEVEKIKSAIPGTAGNCSAEDGSPNKGIMQAEDGQHNT